MGSCPTGWGQSSSLHGQPSPKGTSRSIPAAGNKKKKTPNPVSKYCTLLLDQINLISTPGFGNCPVFWAGRMGRANPWGRGTAVTLWRGWPVPTAGPPSCPEQLLGSLPPPRGCPWDVAPSPVPAEPAQTVGWEDLPDFWLLKSAGDKSCPPSRTGMGPSPPAQHGCAPALGVTPGQSHPWGNRRGGVRSSKSPNSAFSSLLHAAFRFFSTRLGTAAPRAHGAHPRLHTQSQIPDYCPCP